MSENTDNKFKNFAVLTGTVTDLEIKESSSGTRYRAAKLIVTGITYKDEDGGEYHPVIQVLAFNQIRKYLTPGAKLLTGRLSYSEYEDDESEIVRQVKLIASTIKPRKEDDKERAFVNLTLRIGKDAETRLSPRTGFPWSMVRAALSMGKDENDAYRPSLWMTLKAFSGKDGSNEEFVYAVGDLAKGDYVDVKGGLSAGAYKGSLWWEIFLNTGGAAYHDFGGAEDAAEEEFEPEGTRELEAIPD